MTMCSGWFCLKRSILIEIEELDKLLHFSVKFSTFINRSYADFSCLEAADLPIPHSCY